MDEELDYLLTKHLERLGVPEEQWPQAKKRLLKFSQDVLAIESDGDYQATNKKSSAKGGYQFLTDSIAPAANRLETYIGPQRWLDNVRKTKDARTLTPEQQELLFFGDILEKTVKGKKGRGDKYLKGIIEGDNRAAFNLYSEGHHTKPDFRTNVRARNQFGPFDRATLADAPRTGKPTGDKEISLSDARRTQIGEPLVTSKPKIKPQDKKPTETVYKSFGEAARERQPITMYTPFGGDARQVEGPTKEPVKEVRKEKPLSSIFSRPSGRLTPSQQNYYDMMEEARQNNRYNEGGTVNQAQGLASLGRGQDTELVHMTPSEVQGLQTLARGLGGGLTTNPNTGLPEAGFLSNVMPFLVGAALTPFMGPMAAGLAMGGGALAASGGDLKQAAKWGLGGYSGAGIASNLAGAGAGVAPGTAATATTAAAPATATQQAVFNKAATTGVGNFFGNVGTAVTNPTTTLSRLGTNPLMKRAAFSGLAGMAIGAPTPKPYTPESADEDYFYPEGGYKSTRTPTNVAAPQRDARGNIIPRMGEATYFDPNNLGITQVNPNAANVYDMPNYNQGGIVGYANGGLTAGPGDGMSDDIPAVIAGGQPAALSPGEFVVPADVVSDMGNGSSRAGARQLYSMMDRVRKARGGSVEQPEAINPKEYMPA